MSDVPRSLKSWVSTIQSVALTADVFQLLVRFLWTKPTRIWLLILSFTTFYMRSFARVRYFIMTTGKIEIFHKNIEKRQLWVRPMGGWNSTLQAAWYVRHAHWARWCYVSFVICLWITFTIWLLILSSTSFHGRPFARVVYVFLMKYIGGWLPWVLPGSTGRFYKDDVVHDHSAHGYYITRIEGGIRYICMILLHVKQNRSKLIKKVPSI